MKRAAAIVGFVVGWSLSAYVGLGQTPDERTALVVKGDGTRAAEFPLCPGPGCAKNDPLAAERLTLIGPDTAWKDFIICRRVTEQALIETCRTIRDIFPQPIP